MTDKEKIRELQEWVTLTILRIQTEIELAGSNYGQRHASMVALETMRDKMRELGLWPETGDDNG
jgi:hypothetical protein